MKGLKLARLYYKEYGEEMLKTKFPELLPQIAVGLVGSGSECFGFDDELSHDHDFEPAFCIFLPESVDRTTLFALEHAYSKLPREFKGFTKNRLAAVGGNRHGVIILEKFLEARIGNKTGNLSPMDWFFLPEQSVAEVINGELFFDGSGKFSLIRESLKYMPEDVRLKKLAGNLLLMNQAGQYNYNRLISRSDTAAAQLAVIEFVKSALNVIFLLNRTYIPYYKWVFRSLKELSILSHLATDLEALISTDNSNSAQKAQLIEKVCGEIIAHLENNNLTAFEGDSLEAHAYSVNNKITDHNIRNLHILYAV